MEYNSFGCLGFDFGVGLDSGRLFFEFVLPDNLKAIIPFSDLGDEKFLVTHGQAFSRGDKPVAPFRAWHWPAFCPTML